MASASEDRVVVYRAKDGWRWTRYAGNNRKVADSGEAYHNLRDAEDAAKRQQCHVQISPEK